MSLVSGTYNMDNLLASPKGFWIIRIVIRTIIIDNGVEIGYNRIIIK
ncbi:MAG: hypothetical protein JSW00_17600 [Thermoplasmata archaeon]|nr:MAG: hypothetical protein JSW00_17600 [Thermoplasmata archaeon]